MQVSYIIKTRKEKFKTFIGKAIPSEGDNDSFLAVLATGEVFDNLEQAQDYLKKHTPIDTTMFLNPIPSGMMGMSWLSELLDKNN